MSLFGIVRDGHVCELLGIGSWSFVDFRYVIGDEWLSVLLLIVVDGVLHWLINNLLFVRQ